MCGQIRLKSSDSHLYTHIYMQACAHTLTYTESNTHVDEDDDKVSTSVLLHSDQNPGWSEPHHDHETDASRDHQEDILQDKIHLRYSKRKKWSGCFSHHRFKKRRHLWCDAPSSTLLPEQMGCTFHSVCMKDASTWMLPLDMDRCCGGMQVSLWQHILQTQACHITCWGIMGYVCTMR